MAGSVDIELPTLGRCLRVHKAPDVIDALAQAMPGWPITVRPTQEKAPDAYIFRDIDGLWQGSASTAHEYHLPSPASAACSFVGELIRQRLAKTPELVGLHCASIEINERLVLFPESSKAGKSTLTVAFAAAGYKVFGDDVLGLTAQGAGVAMGVAPRLRLPLPDSFSAEFVAYAEQHAGPEDERYRFVIPDKNSLARYDEVSPVGTIVLLERNEHIVVPEVVTLAPGEGLLQLLYQNFAHDISHEVLLARLLPLMQRVPCLLLRYSEPLAGARHLATIIENPHLHNASPASLINYPSATVAETTPFSLESVWRAQHNVSSYSLGEELFLIHTTNGAIHRLNATGKLVWQLLQHESLSGLVLSDILASSFNAPRDVVMADVGALIRALAQACLVTKQH